MVQPLKHFGQQLPSCFARLVWIFEPLYRLPETVLTARPVFQPNYASLSHIFGRKPLLLIALSLFTVGAILAGVANNFTTLLIARSIQGVGAGGIISLTYVIATDMVSLRERGKWFGLISATWALGGVCGPVLGGVMSYKVSWVRPTPSCHQDTS